MSRKLESEVNTFMENTNIELCNDVYKILKYRGNIMKYNNFFVLVKLSRNNPPFFGLNKVLIDTFINTSQSFFCIFLINAQEGWFFPQKDVISRVKLGKWKQYNDKNQYLVNSPLPSELSFSTLAKYNILLERYIKVPPSESVAL